MVSWVRVWTPSWPVHDLNILLVQKGCRVRCCMGWALSWTYTKLRPHTPVTHGNIWFLRIWMYRFRFMAPSTTASSLLPPWWIAPHTMTDGPRFQSLGWTQASISLSPCLQRTRIQPSLWFRENRDSSLKIQCLHCLRFHTLCLLPHSRQHRLCSKVSLGHLAGSRDQYTAARSRLQMVRTDTIRSSWWSSHGVEIFIEPPRFLWCGRPVSRLHRKILLMHPWDTPASWLLLAENCHLPTTWQFTAVFALANFVAWSPLKVQRNINSLYRNPTLHKNIKMVKARQTSLQVTTPKLTFFLLLSLSGPQTILTVFGHSIWLCNGSMKSTVFRSAIEHTTRSNKYQSNSRKCHLVVVIP